MNTFDGLLSDEEQLEIKNTMTVNSKISSIANKDELILVLNYQLKGKDCSIELPIGFIGK